MNILKTQATGILAKYGLKPARAWKGAILCWHRWHQHDVILCWLTTYEEYLKRIVQIYDCKPTSEHAIRFAAFKPVKGKFPITKAAADWKKAAADWKKADADWEKENHDLILRYHKKECADVPFDYKTNSLIFSE